MLVTELTPDQIAEMLRMVVLGSLLAGLLGALVGHLSYDLVRTLVGVVERKPVPVDEQLRRAELARRLAEHRIRRLKGLV